MHFSSQDGEYFDERRTGRIRDLSINTRKLLENEEMLVQSFSIGPIPATNPSTRENTLIFVAFRVNRGK